MIGKHCGENLIRTSDTRYVFIKQCSCLLEEILTEEAARKGEKPGVTHGSLQRAL